MIIFATLGTYIRICRDNYKFLEMIGQKLSIYIRNYIAIFLLNLIGHLWYSTDSILVSGWTFSQNDPKNVRCQTVLSLKLYTSDSLFLQIYMHTKLVIL